MCSRALLSFVSFLALSLHPQAAIAHSIRSVPDESFKFDVHSHIVPDVYRQALITAGYPVVNGTLFTDGFPVPTWNLSTHVAAMDAQGISYATISISAPGLNFLANDACTASGLARTINNLMQKYTAKYPTRLGAMCLLPLPDVPATLKEIKYCLDTLKFDGVGMYTNANGTYLGDAALNPVFELLNNRNATVFVHPAAPGCAGAALGHPAPMTEYPFESVRAMENMLLTGQRANYSNINIIFPHGGGAMPYLATRIAGMASLSFLGSLSVPNTLAQFKNYIFDTASSTSAIQLAAMAAFGGVSKIVTGTDYPYVPQAQIVSGLQATQANGQFTAADMAKINNLNAFQVFPEVAKKLGFAI